MPSSLPMPLHLFFSSLDFIIWFSSVCWCWKYLNRSVRLVPSLIQKNITNLNFVSNLSLTDKICTTLVVEGTYFLSSASWRDCLSIYKLISNEIKFWVFIVSPSGFCLFNSMYVCIMVCLFPAHSWYWKAVLWHCTNYVWIFSVLCFFVFYIVLTQLC